MGRELCFSGNIGYLCGVVVDETNSFWKELHKNILRKYEIQSGRTYHAIEGAARPSRKNGGEKLAEHWLGRRGKRARGQAR